MSDDNRGPRIVPAPPLWFTAGFLLAVVAVLITSAVTSVVSDPNDLEPGQIRILSGLDESVDGQRQRLVSQWNAMQGDDGPQAVIVPLPASTDAQRSEMLARAQAGGDGIDIYNLDVTRTAEFADAGYLQPLDESQMPTDGFLAGPLATCRYDGRLWALPFNTDVGLLYYRTDAVPEQLQQSDAPDSWQTLEERVGTKLARSDAGGIVGFVGQFGSYEGLTVTALEAAWGAGATVVDDAGRALPTDDDADALRAALDRLKKIAPRDLPALDETDSRQRFSSGRALFMRNWPVAYRQLTSARETPDLRFAVAPLPGGAGVLGGQNLAVAAGTDQPRAARSLIRFLTGDRSQQILFERGGLPATRGLVYSDQDVIDAYKSTYVKDFVPQLYNALATARPRPTVPHYAQFSAAFRTVVEDYLRNPAPQWRAADVRDQLDKALKGQVTQD